MTQSFSDTAIVACGTMRPEIAGGEPVWFMTPGWVTFRKLVFKTLLTDQLTVLKEKQASR